MPLISGPVSASLPKGPVAWESPSFNLPRAERPRPRLRGRPEAQLRGHSRDMPRSYKELGYSKRLVRLREVADLGTTDVMRGVGQRMLMNHKSAATSVALITTWATMPIRTSRVRSAM